MTRDTTGTPAIAPPLPADPLRPVPLAPAPGTSMLQR